jgi:thiamine biosynthesis protein ThiS
VLGADNVGDRPRGGRAANHLQPRVTVVPVDVRVNGEFRALPDGSTVGDLIVALGLRPRGVAVERNGEPVQRSRFDSVRLDDGDVLEVVRPVPGG